MCRLFYLLAFWRFWWRIFLSLCPDKWKLAVAGQRNGKVNYCRHALMIKIDVKIFPVDLNSQQGICNHASAGIVRSLHHLRNVVHFHFFTLSL